MMAVGHLTEDNYCITVILVLRLVDLVMVQRTLGPLLQS